MSKSLLIVDDSATMRMIIKKTLRMAELSFECTAEAGNGVEALEKLKEKQFDIILSDINMPEMNGHELVKKIRTEMPQYEATKIIIISTESADNFMDEVLKSGANDYITKPFTPEKFKEKLTQYF